MKAVFRPLLTVAVLFFLASCGDPSKQDILQKAENVSTKADLVDAIGKPDDISKLGPLETWTYKAANGSVVFTIAGDTVTLKTTGD